MSLLNYKCNYASVFLRYLTIMAILIVTSCQMLIILETDAIIFKIADDFKIVRGIWYASISSAAFCASSIDDCNRTCDVPWAFLLLHFIGTFASWKYSPGVTRKVPRTRFIVHDENVISSMFDYSKKRREYLLRSI